MPKSGQARHTVPVVVPKAKRGRGQRLSLVDRYQLLQAHKAHPDWSYERLATEMGCNAGTARFVCMAETKGTVELMAAYTGPMLSLWIKAARIAANRGDYRPLRDWLLHAGAIDPLPETIRNAGPSVVIVNAALPGMPQPTIDAVKAHALEALPAALPAVSGPVDSDK